MFDAAYLEVFLNFLKFPPTWAYLVPLIIMLVMLVFLFVRPSVLGKRILISFEVLSCGAWVFHAHNMGHYSINGEIVLVFYGGIALILMVIITLVRLRNIK